MRTSLVEFLRSGDLGILSIGLTEREVLAAMGQPDDVGVTSRKRKKPCLYLYGDVEIGFDIDPPYRIHAIGLSQHSAKETNQIEFHNSQELDPTGLYFGMTLAEYRTILRSHELTPIVNLEFGTASILTCGGVTAFTNDDETTDQSQIVQWLCSDRLRRRYRCLAEGDQAD